MPQLLQSLHLKAAATSVFANPVSMLLVFFIARKLPYHENDIFIMQKNKKGKPVSRNTATVNTRDRFQVGRYKVSARYAAQ